ncbi:MAG: phosphotransferase [Clostridia bacterium]|nr:phosphotransferase [Clostridia bacterium]
MISLEKAKEVLHEDVKNVTAILKGWSGDEKYLVEGEYNTYLIRVSALSTYEKKKTEFKYIKKVYEKEINTNQPIALINNHGVIYTVLEYVKGKDLEEILPGLDSMTQYEIGLKSGEILSQIHKISFDEQVNPWFDRYSRKTLVNIEKFRQCGVEIENQEKAVSFLLENMDILRNRPQVFQHGDYHIGNMIYDEKGDLAIIDFNRMDFGDSYEEFNRMATFSRKTSIPFATGQIEGYFNRKIPEEFFRLFAFYSISNALGAIPWAIPFGTREVKTMIELTEMVIADFDQLTDCVPVWFKR